MFAIFSLPSYTPESRIFKIRQMLFLIPCLIILPPLFGTLGVWISMPIADTVAAIVTAIVLVKQFKQFKYGT